METYRIGEIIREQRNRRNISQEELCFGICAVTTLSRIENGNQKPSLKVEEALLERLGHSTDNLIEILNNLALVYASEKRSNKAIYILRYLVNTIEKNKMCMDVTIKHYNMLICNLVKQLVINGNYEEAEIYSQKGIEYCKKNKRLNGFPELLYYNAVANSYLKRNERKLYFKSI